MKRLKFKIIFPLIGIVVFLVLIELIFEPSYRIMAYNMRKEVRAKYGELVKNGKLDIPEEGIEAVEFRSREAGIYFIYFYPNDPQKTESRYFAVKHGKWRFKDNRTDEWIEE